MPRDYRLQLDDILEGIKRIKKYTHNLNEEEFSLDDKTQDAVVRNLEIIGEAARSLPDEIKKLPVTLNGTKLLLCVIFLFMNISVLIQKYSGI